MSSDPDRIAEQGRGGLDERVLSTLQGLHGRIAFSGLRRVLHAHPESLSRSLRRLEREGRIDRSQAGYRVTEDGTRTGFRALAELRAVGQVALPPGAIPDSVLGRLAGRWFGTLRWVGVVDGPAGRLLTWARRDGSAYVLLGVHRGSLRVYLRGENAGDDVGEAEDSAYELLVHALDTLRPSLTGPAGSVSFLSAEGKDVDALVDN